MSAVALTDVTYEVAVGGHGPAILFLHGFTGSGAEWGPFLAALAPAHTTVTVDLLGHGATSRPTDPARYALVHQSADLAQILGRLDIGSAIVVGYSYGARIALQLAVDHPARIAGLILESPSAGIADPDERAARRAADEAFAGDLERDGIEAFADRWEAMPMFAGERRLPDPVRGELARRRRANDPLALAAALRGAGQGAMTPLHDRLAAISVPTGILAGSTDAVGLARAQVVATAIPGATMEVLDGVGHAPHREAPDRLAAWLDRALDRIESASAPSDPSPALVPSPQRRSAP